MSGNRWRGSEPNGVDIRAAIEAIATDCGCGTRIVIEPPLNGSDGLYIRTEAFTTTNGVRIGIAKYHQGWTPGGRSLDACIMLALHHVYELAWEHAHAGGYKKTRGYQI